jgi:L-asparaginase/Glu-tRNA(Gln) amidotransferase subunit D
LLFTSPETGPLGRVMEGRVAFWTSSPDRARPIAGFAGPVPEVALVPAFSTRTGAGPVLHRTYSFRGSERDLHRLGLLDAGDLAPLKARVLLTAAMWSTVDRADQETVFAAHAML